jgi:predicted GH43/DUF377 family glycosyl hydrolase
MENFVKIALKHKGRVKPLLVDSALTNGTGLFNPSIFVDDNRTYINIRHCQYTLYHSELNKHEHPYGPLIYFNPENDITLTTTNYFGELNDDLSLKWLHKVDTSVLDEKPLWEFVGLEDCRIVKWNSKIYICGVRRDTTTNGEGRMELSELEIGSNYVKEISRFRIPAPGINKSYCEKNWIPILDEDYKFLKWCNPVEIVTVCPTDKTCVTTYLGSQINFDKDQRGGGQVISWEDGYLTLTHETDLYTSEVGKKNATYRHRLIHWDKNWNVIAKSPAFSFMGAKIEFACGLAQKNDNILITFGFQDNAAFVLECPNYVVKDFINA